MEKVIINVVFIIMAISLFSIGSYIVFEAQEENQDYVYTDLGIEYESYHDLGLFRKEKSEHTPGQFNYYGSCPEADNILMSIDLYFSKNGILKRQETGDLLDSYSMENIGLKKVSRQSELIRLLRPSFIQVPYALRNFNQQLKTLTGARTIELPFSNSSFVAEILKGLNVNSFTFGAAFQALERNKDITRDGGIANQPNFANNTYKVSIVVLIDRSFRCWESQIFISIVKGLPDSKQVYVGAEYSCAVIGDRDYGEVFFETNKGIPSTFQCWGVDTHRADVINSFSGNSSSLVTNTNQGSDRFKAFSAGDRNICYIDIDSILKCLGDGSNGKLGSTSSTDSNSPQTISISHNFDYVDIAYYGICGITIDSSNNNNVYCFGQNRSGMFGRNDRNSSYSTPVEVRGLSGATQIALANEALCAIIGKGDSNTIKCLGENRYRQLGQRTSFRDSSTPLVVNNTSGNPITGAKAISGGDHHFCILTFDNKIACWGRNGGSYDLGVGISGSIGTPTEIPDVTGVIDMDVSGKNTCFIYGVSTTLKCIGDIDVDITSTEYTYTSVRTGDKHVCITNSNNEVWCLTNSTDSRNKTIIGKPIADDIEANKLYKINIP